ncbi:hypothetical protein [Legionella pneumophila]|uniref:hypothetical protein n=1 Tax=Legionella pneumophila TaxID=446 RepID=UPI00277B9792|nr:hypothetical protein [Legionella pneumophila]
MKITKILLLPEDIDPNPFVSEDTLLLRKVTSKSDTFFERECFEYYSESRKCYRSIYYRELEKLSFPAANAAIVSIKDNPLFISRIINTIDEYKLWEKSEQKLQEGNKDIDRKSFVSKSDRYIRIHVEQVSTGISMGIIFNTTEDLSITVVSDDEEIMNNFVKLIKTNDDFDCSYQHKSTEYMQIDDNLYKKTPKVKFSFWQNFSNGSGGWKENKLKSLQYLLDALEKTTNQALDEDIYYAAHLNRPGLDITKVVYESIPKLEYNPDEKQVEFSRDFAAKKH